MPIDPNEPTYCICNGYSSGTMVGCDNREAVCPILHFSFLVRRVTSNQYHPVFYRMVPCRMCGPHWSRQRKMDLPYLSREREGKEKGCILAFSCPFTSSVSFSCIKSPLHVNPLSETVRQTNWGRVRSWTFQNWIPAHLKLGRALTLRLTQQLDILAR